MPGGMENRPQAFYPPPGGMIVTSAAGTQACRWLKLISNQRFAVPSSRTEYADAKSEPPAASPMWYRPPVVGLPHTAAGAPAVPRSATTAARPGATADAGP